MQRHQRHAQHDPLALEMLFNDIQPTSRALLLSQAGDAVSCAFTAPLASADTWVPDAEYRVLVLRRLRLPLPLAPKRYPCGGRVDEYGDHLSACAQVGVLARKAGPLERWERESHRTSASVSSTLTYHPATDAASRLSPMDSPFGRAPRSRWMPQS